MATPVEFAAAARSEQQALLPGVQGQGYIPGCARPGTWCVAEAERGAWAMVRWGLRWSSGTTCSGLAKPGKAVQITPLPDA